MTEQRSEAPEKRKFHPADAVYAILSVLFAFLFLKYALATAPGIALFLTTALFLAATFVYAGVRKTKITGASILWAAVLLGIAAVFPLTGNGFLKFWCAVFELSAGAYWIYLTFGNRSGKFADDMLGFDLIKSLILLPFGNAHQSVLALADSGKKNKSYRTVLFIALGLLIALLPTILVFSLLSAGDTTFANLVEYLFSDVGKSIGSNIACLIFAIPFGILIFGLLYGSAEHKFARWLTREHKETVNSVLRIAPPVIACTALTPMLLIYVLFFVSQAGYFLGAFQNLRPEDYTYAEYAREGFFHLVAVCAINGAMILAVHFLTKRTGKRGYSVIAKIYVILFSLSSVTLAVIALRKMLMYVDRYGLTLLRVYASWFMILLSVFFLILIVKQFAAKFNGILAGLISFAVLFGGLCLCNVDTRIAEYNLNRYIAAENKTNVDLDCDMFYYDLSDGAVIAVDKAYDRLDEKGKTFADQYFARCAQKMSADLEYVSYAESDYRYLYSFRSWNLDTARAEAILRERCPEAFENAKRPYGWTW